jgi:hypothetical protein
MPIARQRVVRTPTIARQTGNSKTRINLTAVEECDECETSVHYISLLNGATKDLPAETDQKDEKYDAWTNRPRGER